MIVDVDNQEELRAALKKVESGDTIHFGEGERYTKFSLNKSGVKLDGDGAEVNAAGSSFGILVRADNTTVDGFEVYGSKGSGISVRQSDYVTVSNNDTHDNDKPGIYTNSSDHLTIINNKSHDNIGPLRGAGISIHVSEEQSAGSWIKVIGNHVYENSTTGNTEGWGIILDGKYGFGSTEYTKYAGKVSVIGNEVHGNHASGILALGYKDVEIVGNKVYDNCHGRSVSGEIGLRFTGKAVLKDNIVDSHGEDHFDYSVRHDKAMDLAWNFTKAPADPTPDIAILGHQQQLPNGEFGRGSYHDYHLDW